MTGHLRRWLLDRRWSIFAGLYAGLFSTLVWLVGLDLYYESSAPIAGFDWIVVAAFAVATGVLAYRVVTEFWRGLKEAAESSERE